MATRFPLEYEINPKSVPAGMRWLTLRLKNIGAEPLTGLDVRLNSLDAYSINVYRTGSYVAVLSPDEERLIPFQVAANGTTSVYATVDGWQDGDTFHWETPGMLITVGEEAAELVSLFAMTEPYPALETTIRCEAVVRGLNPSGGLTLEFWADTPSGEFEELASVETKALDAGEEARYSAEITGSEKGSYTIYAYLYEGVRRIGRKMEHIYVT
ncbi:MAG: hypothetical protein ACLFTI_11985 [Anaerolineales bacterium]